MPAKKRFDSGLKPEKKDRENSSRKGGTSHASAKRHSKRATASPGIGTFPFSAGVNFKPAPHCTRTVSASYLFNAYLFQVLICPVVKLRQTGGVIGITFGNAEHHALTRSRQKYAIRVDLIGFAFRRADILPLVSSKRIITPPRSLPTQIAIPNQTRPDGRCR